MPELDEREIETALYYEREVGEGVPIAAIAWNGEDWAVAPAKDAPPFALATFMRRLGEPIAQKVQELTELGYLTPSRKLRATSPTEAARAALHAAGRAG